MHQLFRKIAQKAGKGGLLTFQRTPVKGRVDFLTGGTPCHERILKDVNQLAAQIARAAAQNGTGLPAHASQGIRALTDLINSKFPTDGDNAALDKFFERFVEVATPAMTLIQPAYQSDLKRALMTLTQMVSSRCGTLAGGSLAEQPTITT